MGRRSTHSSEELKQLIIDAARRIIERDGLVGLSAREIARDIGYSAGTLYNIFENLDDILMTLQVELLEKVEAVLREVASNATGVSPLNDMTDAYINFALENRKLWNLLFTHAPNIGLAEPHALHSGINSLIELVEKAIAPSMPNGSTSEATSLAARSLWAGVHGITAIAVTEKSPKLKPETAQDFVRQLTTVYLAGLRNTTP